MSEPMDKREEVELPPIEPTEEDGYQIRAWMKDYPNETSSFWAVQVRLLGRERQLKSAIVVNREKDAEIERLKAAVEAWKLTQQWQKRVFDLEAELASLRASGGEKEGKQ